MGQRLVITIENEKESLAKIYYHWSAYTSSSLFELQKLLPVIQTWQKESNSEKDLQLRLIRFVENNGGGIDGGSESEEFAYIKTVFSNEEFKRNEISRNEGLIAISKKGMKDIQGWSEGNIYINVETNMIQFDVIGGVFNTIDEFNECWGDEEEKYSLEDIPETYVNFEYFSFDELDTVVKEIMPYAQNEPYAVRYDGSICTFVE